MSAEVRLCQICGAREVTLSVAVWRDGREDCRTFLCAKCADREEKLTLPGSGGSVSRLTAYVAERQALRAGADSEKGCPLCGATLEQSVADGLLGCGYCYTRFKTEVTASIRLAQGTLRHIGKTPFDR